MNPDRDDNPQVIDLRRYRKAVEDQAKAQAKARREAPKAANPQAFLGGRRHAGLILAAVVLGLLALSVGPALVTQAMGWLSFSLG